LGPSQKTLRPAGDPGWLLAWFLGYGLVARQPLKFSFSVFVNIDQTLFEKAADA